MRSTDTDVSPVVDAGAVATGDLLPTLIRLVRMIRYRKRILLSTLYAFCLVSAIYYCLAPRLFESKAKILIVEQKQDQFSPVTGNDAAGNVMATHREIVVSPVVIKRAIEQLEPQYRAHLYQVSPHKWVKTIQKNLNASITRRTNIIDVSYRSQDRQAAAAVVRAVIQAYLDFVEENHKGTAGEISTLLTQKRDEIQATLEAKQAELQKLRQQTGHLAISTDDEVEEPMIQRALSLNTALLEAQQKRIVLQATLSSVKQAVAKGESASQHLMGLESDLGQQMFLASMGMGPEDLRVLGEQKKKLLATAQEMQGLANVYGPNHPRMQQLRQEMQVIQQYLRSYGAEADRQGLAGNGIPNEVVLKLLNQAVERAKQVEHQLNQSYELARTEAAKHSGALIQLRTLERDVARTEALSDSLIDSIAKIDLRQVQAPIKATVVREPLPGESPVSPQLRFVIFFSLGGGMLLGVMIIYVQDFLDDRFASPEDISAQLNVPVLAIIRKLEPLPGEGLDSIHTYALANSVESEAFRTLRTTLSLGGEVCDRILVSSSEPGDGKTTVSANLAVAFAQAGRKTLVIDADLRRPGFSALLGFKGLHGVADLLASDEAPETLAPELIQHTSLNNLDILPVGLRRPNPAELLSGKAFVELLAWADSRYERVLVDCPPVLAVSDAQIVGQLVDGAILVVQPDKNHRRSVMRAVESFQETGCRVLGVVANRVSHETGEYSYSYGYGYGYGYDEAYGHDSDADEGLEAHHLAMEPTAASPSESVAFDRKKAELPSSHPDSGGIRPRRAA